jgi:hypothetical protein
MKTFILLIAGFLLVLSLTSCTPLASEPSEQLLSAQGYSDVKIGTWTPLVMLKCSEDDVLQTPFTAVSPAGVEVSGVVCQGLFKGATIRF